MLFSAVIFLVFVSFYQNCSLSNQVNFSAANRKAAPGISLDYHGEGYMGKPEEGTYVRTSIGYQCIDGDPLVQGLMTVDATQGLVTLDNCIDLSFPASFSDSRFDYRPYNPDYLGFGAAVYERRTDPAAPADHAVEALCRQSDNSGGVDVVVKLRADSTANVKIYSGALANGTWSRSTSSDFKVQRTVTSQQLAYSSSNFNLQVDISNSPLSEVPGNLVAQIDGKNVPQTVSCRYMRPDSFVLYDYSAAGLAAFWQFSGNFLDVSGNGNHGTPVDNNNSIQFAPAVLGEGVLLDGNDDFIQVSPSISLNNLPTMTIAAWIWPSSADYPSGQSRGGIARKADAVYEDATQGWEFGVGAQTLNLYFLANLSGPNMLTSVAGLVANSWNHVAVSWDGTGDPYSGVRFYINGIHIPTTYGLVGSGSRTDDSPYPLKLGDFTDGDTYGYDERFEGQMDQLSIWNRILTDPEVQNIFSTGTPAN
jgi:hypothetical protein